MNHVLIIRLIVLEIHIWSPSHHTLMDVQYYQLLIATRAKVYCSGLFIVTHANVSSYCSELYISPLCCAGSEYRVKSNAIQWVSVQ